jgi:tetratricopeptide (TPR) repeat protein
METQAPQMDWLYILGLMSFSGAFGGALSVLQLYDVRKLLDESEAVSFSRNRFFAALILGISSGIGGSISMLFVISATAKLDTNPTTANKLLLCSLGMISGFLGYRALGGVASRVEKQISEIDAKTDRKLKETKIHLEELTEKKIGDAKDTVKSIAEYWDSINMGLDAAGDKNGLISEDLKAISRLERLREQMPGNREVAIILARIYAKLNDHVKAIEILTNLIVAIEGTGRDKDTADALFNRACYYNLIADSEAGDKKAELKTKAYVDLKESIRLSPENKEDATTDPDLQSLRDDERVKQLIAS